jgi:hypothetical protein
MRWMIALMIGCGLAAAQPVLTTVQDTIYDLYGNLYSGPLTISLSAQGVTQGTTQALSVVKNLFLQKGVLNVSLVPTDTATPTGAAYIFTFGNGAVKTCVIPTSTTPITLAAYCIGSAINGGMVTHIPVSWLAHVGASGINSVNPVGCVASPVFDLALGNMQTLDLSCDVTSSSLLHLTANTVVMFRICQPAVGGPYSFTWPAAVIGGIGVGRNPGACSAQWFYSSDGTYLRSLGLGVVNQ